MSLYTDLQKREISDFFAGRYSRLQCRTDHSSARRTKLACSSQSTREVEFMRSSLLLLCTILASALLWGVAEKNQKSVNSFVAASNKNALKVTLKASRDQAIAGSDFGITAQIENTSDKPVYTLPPLLQ